MIRSARAGTLRSTALATSLALVVGLAAITADAWAAEDVPAATPAAHAVSKTAASKSAASKGTAAKTDAKADASKAGTSKPHASKPAAAKSGETKTNAAKTDAAKTASSKSGAAKTDGAKAASSKTDASKATASKSSTSKATAAKTTASKPASPAATGSLPNKPAPVRAAAPALVPATRQHAAPIVRKPVLPAAVAATSSTSQSDKEALASVVELLRKRKAADATEAEASISDPVARKLAEWLILRSEDNGASVERYRAFLDANPSWPSQTFLRRRIEASLWDDRRDDSAVWAWFQNESPVSAKGRLALAKVMIGRGDRGNAERLVREAWRNDGMSEDTETTALEMFGSFLTAADHKARMDTMLYGTDNEAAGIREAKRLGSGYLALAKARIAANRKGSNLRALLEAVPSELTGDTGYLFAKIQLLRREEKFAEAARLMLSAPKDAARLYNVDEWWVERRLLARKMIDVEEFRTAYLIARDAALPARDIYKTEQEFTSGWIALRFLNDPQTAAQHFARIGVGSVNPTTLARGGYWRGRAAEAMGHTQDARAFYASAAEQSTSYYGQLARARLGMPQLELNEAPRARGVERLEIVRAVQLLFELDEREIAIPILADV
ncbi:MAG TPA: lytic transglycosylase domain-containing protein, partial [Bradyrhizobium sp.]